MPEERRHPAVPFGLRLNFDRLSYRAQSNAERSRRSLPTLHIVRWTLTRFEGGDSRDFVEEELKVGRLKLKNFNLQPAT
jgi:hypothetical protein